MYEISLENLVLEARKVIDSKTNHRGYVKIIPNGDSTKALTDKFVEKKVLFYVEGLSQPPLNGLNKAYEIDLNQIKIVIG